MRRSYLVLVSLFEPKGTAETKGEILAGLNAAPTAGRVIGRIAPMLGVVPDGAVAAGGLAVSRLVLDAGSPTDCHPRPCA